MVLNPDECQFMVLSDLNYTRNLTCSCTTIECSKEERVLGKTIYDKLIFTSHVGNIIKKANQKLHVLVHEAFGKSKMLHGFKRNKFMSYFEKSPFN